MEYYSAIKKEWTTDTPWKADASQNQCFGWKKLDTENTIYGSTYIMFTNRSN